MYSMGFLLLMVNKLSILCWDTLNELQGFLTIGRLIN